MNVNGSVTLMESILGADTTPEKAAWDSADTVPAEMEASFLSMLSSVVPGSEAGRGVLKETALGPEGIDSRHSQDDLSVIGFQEGSSPDPGAWSRGEVCSEGEMAAAVLSKDFPQNGSPGVESGTVSVLTEEGASDARKNPAERLNAPEEIKTAGMEREIGGERDVRASGSPADIPGAEQTGRIGDMQADELWTGGSETTSRGASRGVEEAVADATGTGWRPGAQPAEKPLNTPVAVNAEDPNSLSLRSAEAGDVPAGTGRDRPIADPNDAPAHAAVEYNPGLRKMQAEPEPPGSSGSNISSSTATPAETGIQDLEMADSRFSQERSDPGDARLKADRVLAFGGPVAQPETSATLISGTTDTIVLDRVDGALPSHSTGASSVEGNPESGSVLSNAALWAVRDRILDQLANETRWLVRTGKTEAEIQLEPPELGKLRLRLTVSNGSVRGFIEVENPGVYSALQSDLSRLTSLLAEKGLDLTQFDVLLKGERQNEGSDRFGEAPQRSGSRTSSNRSDEGRETGERNVPRGSLGGSLLDYWL